jgi:hypothetical protein
VERVVTGELKIQKLQILARFGVVGQHFRPFRSTVPKRPFKKIRLYVEITTGRRGGGI